jgi:hypothetical protein
MATFEEMEAEILRLHDVLEEAIDRLIDYGENRDEWYAKAYPPVQQFDGRDDG